MKKLLSFILASVLLLTSVFATAPAFADEKPMEGKTVVIYTSNLRGNPDWLPKLKAAKKAYEDKGAIVYLVDTGNFLQGSALSAYDRGNTFFELFAKTGYEAIALGEYDFTFGNAQMGAKPHGTFQQFDTLTQLADKYEIRLLSANAAGGNDSFNFQESENLSSAVKFDVGGNTMCFIAVTNPHVAELCPDNLEGIAFKSGDDIYTIVNNKVEKYNSDCSICISNAPGLDFANKTNVSYTIDGSGSAAQVGALCISNDTHSIEQLPINLDDYTPDAELQALVDDAKAKISGAEGDYVNVEKTISGKQSAVRSEEAPIGNLFCDALKWYAESGKVLSFYDPDEIERGNDKITVSNDNIIALFNGGNLRDSLYAGNATIKDLQRVLPYPNKVAVAYVTGAQLLEALEASMQLPAAFAQVSGIDYTIYDNVEFVKGEQYEASSYYKSAYSKIKINSVNGKAFNENATYAVITSNFVANGGDTYAVFRDKGNLSTVTTRNVTDAVWDFIKEKYNGVVPSSYSETKGRIHHEWNAPLEGKTVLLYTSNLRGNPDWLPRLKAAKKDYENKGATVFLVDTGNFLHGSTLSSYDMGNTFFELFAKAGYDAAALGEYDFIYGKAQMGARPHGTFQQLKTLTQLANDNHLTLLSSNALGSNDSFDFRNTDYMANTIMFNKNGKSVCFVAVTNPHANTLCPDNLDGIVFKSGSDMYDMVSNCVDRTGADFSICIANAPNIGTVHTKVNLAISYPDSSAEATVGGFIISNDYQDYEMLPVNLNDYTPDAELQALVDEAKAKVSGADNDYVQVEKTVSGTQADVRSKEAPIGNLFTDALKWYAESGKVLDYYDADEIERGNNKINVPSENIISIFNGGNLRDSLYEGNATIKDIQRILPYPNTVAVAYVTGAQLLEALEASTQLPAAFAQVSGINYTIYENVNFEKGEQYEASDYYKNAANKIRINSVNGRAFSETATYAVITSNFLANGGDTYAVFKNKGAMSTVTSRKVTDAVFDYIKEQLGGKVPASYAETKGRITFEKYEETPDAPVVELKTSIVNAKVTGITSKVYSGKKITQKITVKLDGKTLKNGTDYKVVYENNTKVGTATVEILGIGNYTDGIATTFKINPKGTKLSKVTAGKKSFTATWKKNATQTTGYQLQYGTKSNFSGAKTVNITKNKTTKKAVKKLKANKKYFVRVRTYKTVKGKKYYSSWSAVKAVKTKK